MGKDVHSLGGYEPSMKFLCSAFYLLPAVILGCGLHPKNLPTHRIVAKDGVQLDAVEDLRFGVLGNTRTSIPLLDSGKGNTTSDAANGQILGDLMWQNQQGALDFVVLMGDMVRASRDKEWAAFDTQWRDLLDGSTLPEIEGKRLPVLPVAGDRESLLDERLKGFGATFPGFGADIGFNRVASWSFFDQVIGGTKWRFIVLDSNKEGLGSRWKEQLFWLPTAARGDYEHMLVFMHDSRISLSSDVEMNRGGVAQELVEVIEQHAGLMKLSAVFSSSAHSSEIFLPEGRLGTAYVGAGGGGARASSVNRWGDGAPAGLEHMQLEPAFDLALQGSLAKRDDLEQDVIDEARAEGEWEGFIGRYNSKHFPLYGYWMVDIQGEKLGMSFRLLTETGALKEAYSLNYAPKAGWSQP
jgi:hypothetical protein